MCDSVDEVTRAVLAKNDGLAADLRDELARRAVSVVNLLSSPGSGKTELLGRVLARAVERSLPVAALTADLATENDADADADAADVGAAADAGHPAALGHVAVDDRIPAASPDQAFGRVVVRGEAGLLVVRATVAALVDRLPEQPLRAQHVVQRRRGCGAGRVVEDQTRVSMKFSGWIGQPGTLTMGRPAWEV